MKIVRIITFSIILLILYEFVRDLLVVLYIIRIDSVIGILYILSTICLLGILYKHRYWISSCILLAIHELVKLSVRESFKTHKSAISIEKDTSAMLVMLGGMVLLVLSLILAYKFLRLKNYGDYFIFKNKIK